MPRAIKGILFDKDGTLIDYHLTWGPINRAAIAIASAGDTDLASRLYAIGGMDPVSGITEPDSLLAAGHTREIVAAFIDAGSPFEPDELVAAFDDLFVQAQTTAVAITDIGSVFADLEGIGRVLGIASSDSEASIRRMVGHFGLSRYLSFIAGYDSGHGYKPGPGMVRAFADAMRLEPAEIAVVGDNLHDISMGRSAGAGLCIAVLSGTGTLDSLSASADVCLTDIGELPAFFRDRGD